MALAIRTLEPDETARTFPARQQMDLSEYTEALRELRAGDTAAVALQDLSRRSLKRRLNLAAKELGYRVSWSKQAGEGEVYLRVVQVPVDGTRWTRRRTARRKT